MRVRVGGQSKFLQNSCLQAHVHTVEQGLFNRKHVSFDSCLSHKQAAFYVLFLTVLLLGSHQFAMEVLFLSLSPDHSVVQLLEKETVSSIACRNIALRVSIWPVQIMSFLWAESVATELLAIRRSRPFAAKPAANGVSLYRQQVCAHVHFYTWFALVI